MPISHRDGGTIPVEKRPVTMSRAAGERRSWRLLWPAALVTLAAIDSTPAQVPAASRDEVLRQWDLDGDGKVDATEMEVARSRMRRSRSDLQPRPGIDPVTGRPRQAVDPVTGRQSPRVDDRAAGSSPSGGPAADPAADDGGLILVPGTGARTSPNDTRSSVPSAIPERPSTAAGRQPLPGNRVPAPAATVPSLMPRSPLGAVPSAAEPRRSAGPPEPPGIGAAGSRPAGIGGRVVPGAKPNDLNAGRLPAGFPQARSPASGAFGGLRPPPAAPPDPTGAARRGTALQPGAASAAAARAAGSRAGPLGPVDPRVPKPQPGLGTRAPSGFAPGATGQIGQPQRLPTASPTPRPPTTTPRVPRPSIDDFYGR